MLKAAGDLAEAFFEGGFFEEAIKLCEQSIGVAEEELGPSNAAIIIPLHVMAKASLSLGKIHESVQYYSFLQSILNTNLGSTHPETIAVGLDLISIYMQTGNIHNAAVLCHRYRAWLQESLASLNKESLSVAADHNEGTLGSKEYEVLVHALESEQLEAHAALGDIHFFLSSVWKRHMDFPTNSQEIHPEQWRPHTEEHAVRPDSQSGEFDVEDKDENEQAVAEPDFTESAVGEAVSLVPAEEEWMFDVEHPHFAMNEHLLLAAECRRIVVEAIEARAVTTGQPLSPNDFKINGDVDARAKLAQALQGLATSRFQQGDAGDDVLDMFRRLLDIAYNLAANNEGRVSNKFRSIVGRDDKESGQVNEVVQEDDDADPEVEDYAEEADLQAKRVQQMQHEEMVEYRKDIAIALNNLGSVHMSRGEYTQAEEYFRKSLEVRVTTGGSPTDVALARGNLAKALLMTGQTEVAEKEYFEALESVASTVGTSHVYYQQIEGTFSRLKALLQTESQDKQEKEMLSHVDAETPTTTHLVH